MRLPYVSRVAFEAALSRAATEQDSARSLSKQLLSEMNRRDRECIRANEAEMEVTHLNDTIRNLHNENEALRESNRGLDAQLAEQITRAVSADERAEAFRQSAAHADAARISADASALWLQQELAKEREEKRDLLEKYHALRSQGFAPIDAHAFPLVESPLSKLGEKTKAALTVAGKGLPRASRAAMENAALTMFVQGLDDAVIAEAVRKGETLRRVG